MAHAVSATFTRFEHMSPPAAALALLLHALVAILLWWSSPLHHDDDAEDKAIEVRMEAPPPPPPQPAPQKPEPPKPAPPKPPPPQAAPTPPTAYTPFQPAAPLDKKNEGAKRPTAEAPEAKPVEKIEELAPEKSDARQQALAQPPAPAPPPLEKELPPVETPPAPLTSRDFPKPAPRTPDPKPQPKPPVQAPPQPQQNALAPSPLSRLPPRGAPPPSAGRSSEPQSPFVNPADVRARNDIANSYLQQVVYKVSVQRPMSADPAWLRLLVGVRVIIARDGRLLDIAVVRSSGNAEADRVVLQTFREASPFAPLPAELPGESFSFSLPFGFVAR